MRIIVDKYHIVGITPIDWTLIILVVTVVERYRRMHSYNI